MATLTGERIAVAGEAPHFIEIPSCYNPAGDNAFDDGRGIDRVCSWPTCTEKAFQPGEDALYGDLSEEGEGGAGSGRRGAGGLGPSPL